MQRTLIALSLLASLSFSALAEDAPATKDTKEKDPNAPFVVVNGSPVPAFFADFVRQNRASRNLPPELLTDASIRDSLVGSELLVQEALKKGLDKEPSIAAAIEFQKHDLLGKAAIEDFARKNPISEDKIKEEYDKAKAKAGDTEYRASHILVPTEKEAKEVLAALKKPKAKFEDVAKKYSKDSSSAQGGDLGWNIPANLVPEFAEAMVALKKGQTTTAPVQSKFGWHIIRLTDQRKLDYPTYDQLKGRIANQLQQLAIRNHVQSLRAEAKVE